MFRAIISPIFRSTGLCVTVCGIMHPRCCGPVAWKRSNCGTAYAVPPLPEWSCRRCEMISFFSRQVLVTCCLFLSLKTLTIPNFDTTQCSSLCVQNRYVFSILNFRRVLIVVSFLLGKSPASLNYCMPTFRNSLSVPSYKAIVLEDGTVREFQYVGIQ